jgi:HJR/Mrr/RecB family endonuclease
VTIGWLVWAVLWGRRRKIKWEKLMVSKSVDEMHNLSPTDFEKMVGRVYEAKGYKVEHRGGSGDKGVDLMLTDSKGYHIAVQCKRYNWTLDKIVFAP